MLYYKQRLQLCLQLLVFIKLALNRLKTSLTMPPMYYTKADVSNLSLEGSFFSFTACVEYHPHKLEYLDLQGGKKGQTNLH